MMGGSCSAGFGGSEVAENTESAESEAGEDGGDTELGPIRGEY